MFKRQLYNLYEVQNRSVDEHEAFSFEIQRQNLKWLWNANQDYSKEMERLNALEDLNAHANLNGAIFRRKAMSPARVHGLGYFAVSAMSYLYFPYVVNTLGYTLTLFGITATSLMGMHSFSEKNVINSIEWTAEGKLKFNISTSPISSRDIVVDQRQAQGCLSLGNDDMGTTDVENNIVQLTNFTDGGKLVERELFTLPADAWKDLNVLDWVLSIKNEEHDSTEADFNDLMHTQFSRKQETGGISSFELMKINSNYDKINSGTAVDRTIENGDASLDKNLQEMTEFYGKEHLSKMTPGDFYVQYKKFASGAHF